MGNRTPSRAGGSGPAGAAARARAPRLKGQETLGSASVPVAIGTGLEPRFTVAFDGAADGISFAFVEEAQGVLTLETAHWSLVLIANLAKLLTGIGLATFFHLLRRVLQSIIEGVPFAAQTGARIRRIGYLVLLLGFLVPTVQYVAAYEILNRLPGTQPALSLPSPFNPEIILASLLILILAQVWSYGLRLEHDQALTI